MKVHIQQIPPEGLHLEGDEPSEILDLDDTKFLAPVHYSLDVGLSDGGLFATGRLATRIEVECGSCLTRFTRTVEVPDFVMQIPLDGPETVDLTPHIREDIVLALPPYPRCDWDGDRTCRGPLLHSEPEPEPAVPEAWEALDKLDLNKGK